MKIRAGTCLLLALVWSVSLFGNGCNQILSFDFYADFNSKDIKKAGYYDMNGLKVKLPAKINDWPANDLFDVPPEVVIVKGKIKKRGAMAEKTEFYAEIRFKISKIINDENGEMDIEKSERNQYWDKRIIKKKIEIKNIKKGK